MIIRIFTLALTLFYAVPAISQATEKSQHSNSQIKNHLVKKGIKDSKVLIRQGIDDLDLSLYQFMSCFDKGYKKSTYKIKESGRFITISAIDVEYPKTNYNVDFKFISNDNYYMLGHIKFGKHYLKKFNDVYGVLTIMVLTACINK